MLHRSRHSCCAWLLAVLLLASTQGARAEGGERPAGQPTPSPAAIAEYRRKLEEYTAARRKYEAEADAYWNSAAPRQASQRP